jgi:hypothetical protein
MTQIPPYRNLVVPEHLRFYDAVVAHLEKQIAAAGEIAISAPIWAALCTALAQSIQAHRAHADAGNDAAAARLPLAEQLLADLTNADDAGDVVPIDFPPLPGTLDTRRRATPPN